MELCYYHGNTGSFRGDLDAWLWSKLLLYKGKPFLARQQLKRLIKEGKSFNSNPAVIRSHTSQMLERLAQLTIDANKLQDRLK